MFISVMAIGALVALVTTLVVVDRVRNKRIESGSNVQPARHEKSEGDTHKRAESDNSVQPAPAETRQAALTAAIAKLNALSPRITSLHATIEKLASYESGYLMKKDWDNALSIATPIVAELSKAPRAAIDACNYAIQIRQLLDWCRDPLFREIRNMRYKDHELQLCDALLSNVDGGKSLDRQQRDAVVTDEYNNLVIAGAGSGKTAVVVGKVKYLVERWGVDPSQILVTSFTRASVNDLKSRIESSGVHGVSAKTFHALGLGVLGNDYAVAPEGALRRHVTSYFAKELSSNPRQAAAFLEFFGLWNLSQGESPDAEEAEVRMKLLKAQDMRTLKGLIQERGNQGNMDTLRGERVKSIEELMIANFLFLNGVAYEYETPYPHEIPEELNDKTRRAYQPDFYLVDYDIWLEHFGVDEYGRVPWMKTQAEEQNYIDGMNWKRDVHKACGTKLIESYSYWNKDQDLLNQVERLLKKNGVILRNDPERNADICGDLLRDERFFSSMSQLVSTFISLVKSSNRTITEVDDAARVAYRGNGAMWHRYTLFTEFAWPILKSYQRSLASGAKPMVDFDDMINGAAEHIRKYGYGETYRYIIVDEYQDISLSRFGLLSAIRDATGAKLMCVGDDWQSIYRFAGSDVTLFTNFGKLVGYFEEMRIERTYRNSQRLVDAARRFVLKNPDQLRKAVVSSAPAQRRSPIAVASLSDQRAAFTFALNDLLTSEGGGGEIKVLGRNKRDLERIFPDFQPTAEFSFRDPRRGVASEEKFDKVIRYKPAGGYQKEIGYMTVHKAKGLQADNVVVIGLVNDRYGFPNMIVDDPLLELLLADSDKYMFAEERRLFYVALTRTRHREWLVTGSNAGSPGMSTFVDELRSECDTATLEFYSEDDPESSVACPRCGGVLLKRKGSYGYFVGCSNYPFCDKTYSDVAILEYKRKCPVCGGWLTKRIRRDGSGEFFGCTNYPKYCHYAMNLDGTAAPPQSSSGRGRLSGTFPVVRVSTEYDRTGGGAKGNDGFDAWVSEAVADAGGAWENSRSRSTRSNGTKRTTGLTCPQCGSPMKLKSGSRGKFYSCTRYPSCRGTRDYPASRESGGHGTRSRASKAKDSTPKCPECGARMVLRSSRFGQFYGCSRFPECEGKRDYK